MGLKSRILTVPLVVTYKSSASAAHSTGNRRRSDGAIHGAHVAVRGGGLRRQQARGGGMAGGRASYQATVPPPPHTHSRGAHSLQAGSAPPHESRETGAARHAGAAPLPPAGGSAGWRLFGSRPPEIARERNSGTPAPGEVRTTFAAPAKAGDDRRCPPPTAPAQRREPRGPSSSAAAPPAQQRRLTSARSRFARAHAARTQGQVGRDDLEGGGNRPAWRTPLPCQERRGARVGGRAAAASLHAIITGRQRDRRHRVRRSTSCPRACSAFVHIMLWLELIHTASVGALQLSLGAA